MKMRKAFTLIELLVVIAIIAILAAILFPVFAQAKVAAKGAASISNDKQINTAHMIYQTDYDDNPVLEGQGDADAPFLLNGLPYKPWSYLLLPYTKNGDIMQDPLTSKEPNPFAPNMSDQVLYTYRTQFGYAFTIHCPVNYTGTAWVPTPTPQTALANPAQTVMFVSKKDRQGNGDWLWVGSFIWGGNLVSPPAAGYYTTDPNVNPFSYIVPITCWGDGCSAYASQTEENGRYTGGVSLRKATRSVVGFSDGHVSPLGAGQIAAGTNWRKTLPAFTCVVTDKKKYLWDME